MLCRVCASDAPAEVRPLWLGGAQKDLESAGYEAVISSPRHDAYPSCLCRTVGGPIRSEKATLASSWRDWARLTRTDRIYLLYDAADSVDGCLHSSWRGSEAIVGVWVVAHKELPMKPSAKLQYAKNGT